MDRTADQLEALAWEEPPRCRPDAPRHKPPRRYSPRFDKKRSVGHAGMHRRGTRG